jgi:hypothetical protein
MHYKSGMALKTAGSTQHVRDKRPIVFKEMSFARVLIRSIGMKERVRVRPSCFANLVVDVVYPGPGLKVHKIEGNR